MLTNADKSLFVQRMVEKHNWAKHVQYTNTHETPFFKKASKETGA